MIPRHLLASSVLVLALNDAALAGSTLRCGSALISTGDSGNEVQAKCGEPQQRDFIGYREVLDDWGFRQEVTVEEWVYGPRNGMYYFLRLEGNRLANISSKRGR